MGLGMGPLQIDTAAYLNERLRKSALGETFDIQHFLGGEIGQDVELNEQIFFADGLTGLLATQKNRRFEGEHLIFAKGVAVFD